MHVSCLLFRLALQRNVVTCTLHACTSTSICCFFACLRTTIQLRIGIGYSGTGHTSNIDATDAGPSSPANHFSLSLSCNFLSLSCCSSKQFIQYKCPEYPVQRRLIILKHPSPNFNREKQTKKKRPPSLPPSPSPKISKTHKDSHPHPCLVSHTRKEKRRRSLSAPLVPQNRIPTITPAPAPKNRTEKRSQKFLGGEAPLPSTQKKPPCLRLPPSSPIFFQPPPSAGLPPLPWACFSAAPG